MHDIKQRVFCTAFGCFLIGMIAGIMFVHYYQQPLFERHKEQMDSIAKCEATLPRNKTCEMVALPK